MSETSGAGPTPPTAGEPAWLPDPSGRHQLRWFDGASFTDQVADDGATASDPLAPAAAPPQPFPPTAPGTYAPHTSSANPALPSDVTGRKASRLPVILAVVGALVVIVAVMALLRDGGGDDGAGEFEGEVTEDEPGRHEVSVPGGSIVVVELDPSSDLDAVVGFEVSDDDADRLEELYEDTPLAGATDPVDDLLFRRDAGFDGDEELTFIAAPFGFDATVVVDGFEDGEGDYDVTIEIIGLDDLDDDADGDDVLDAILDNDEVPRELREAIESALGSEDEGEGEGEGD